MTRSPGADVVAVVAAGAVEEVVVAHGAAAAEVDIAVVVQVAVPR